MAKRLFLQGDSGAGKSRLIRENLLPFLPRVGGFFVQRIFILDRYAAFRLKPVENAAEYRLNKVVTSLNGMDNLFLYSDAQGKWHQDLAVFESSGVACLQKSLAGGKDLVLLDELGGVELDCPGFMKAVREVLAGDIPVLGVMKSPRNAEKLAAGLDGQSDTGQNRTFLNYIQRNPGTELLYVSGENFRVVAARVKAFVEAALT